MSFPWAGWQGVNEANWDAVDVVSAPPAPPSPATHGHGRGPGFSGNFFFRHQKAFARLLAKLRREEETEVAPPANTQGIVQSITRKAEVCIPRAHAHRSARASAVAKTGRRVYVAKGEACYKAHVPMLLRKSEVRRPVLRNDVTRIEWEAVEAMLLDEMEDDDELI